MSVSVSPENLDPSFLISFVRDNSRFDADLLQQIIDEWKAYKQAEKAAKTEPERTGRWKRVKWVPEAIEGGDCNEDGYWIVRCTACSIPNDSETRYCPNCGAKMNLSN